MKLPRIMIASIANALFFLILGAVLPKISRFCGAPQS
jgi:hypothetical protein